MPSNVNIADLIASQASAAGIPPAIAQAVAQVESGTSQWTASGNVVTSPKGALGVFQLMPATAASLGVDPTDLTQNIQGGISYLKQMYAKFGNWADALAAYNFGPGNVAAGKPLPTETQNYVSAVTGLANSVASAVSSAGSAVSGSAATASDVLASVVPGGAPVIAIVALVGLGALAWWLSD